MKQILQFIIILSAIFCIFSCDTAPAKVENSNTNLRSALYLEDCMFNMLSEHMPCMPPLDCCVAGYICSGSYFGYCHKYYPLD